VAAFNDNSRGNLVLSSLSPQDYSRIQPFLLSVPLRHRQCLEIANREASAVYFPYRGVVSVVAVSKGKRHEGEVGVIGWEGMTGASVVLGTGPSPHNIFVQVEGDGRSIAADDLRAVMAESPTLREAFLRYAHTFFVQAAHTALANARGRLEQRLARWLLMAHDRLPGDALRLTHEFLALMLGVRRAGVTIALQHLESEGLVSTARGLVTVVDRAGLEKCTDGLYGVPEDELGRLFPQA
jgi:CRP-like cAMP-binding protein